MYKPNELKVCVHAVNGEDLCDYVGAHFGIDEYEVFKIIFEHTGLENAHTESVLFELIIEGEDYCNDEGLYYRVLEFIADEFGGHFNITFLDTTAFF